MVTPCSSVDLHAQKIRYGIYRSISQSVEI